MSFVKITCLLTFLIVGSFSTTAFSQVQNDQSVQEELQDVAQKRIANEYFDKAKDSYLQGNSERAIYYYDKAIEAYPHNAKTYIIRGRIKQELGDYEGAINDYTLAITTEPVSDYNKGSLLHGLATQKDSEAYFYRGQAKALANKLHEAIEDLTISIQKHPTSSAYSVRGKVKSQLGLEKEALIDLNKSVMLEISDNN